MQPSASRTELLLECSYPFDPRHTFAPGEVGEPARYGSAFHEVLARVLDHPKANTHREIGRWASIAAKRYALDDSIVEELTLHVTQAAPVLITWLGGKNPWREDFTKSKLETEQSFAWSPSLLARDTASPDSEHVYPELKPRQMGGTVDLLRRSGAGKMALVLDHKTGEDPSGSFSRPHKLPQLLSLAAAVTSLTGTRKSAIVAVFHARRRGLPIVYSEKVDSPTLQEHSGKVFEALLRVGDGSLRPGAWCARCPARSVCPAQDAELLSHAAKLLGGLHAQGSEALLVSNGNAGLTRAQALGNLYEIVKKSEDLAARAREEIRNEIVRTKVMPELADGRHLTVISREVERLSKSTLTRGLGRLAAEREIERLRKIGGLEQATQTQLHAEKE
jgi:hypothetical protein